MTTPCRISFRNLGRPTFNPPRNQGGFPLSLSARSRFLCRVSSTLSTALAWRPPRLDVLSTSLHLSSPPHLHLHEPSSGRNCSAIIGAKCRAIFTRAKCRAILIRAKRRAITGAKCTCHHWSKLQSHHWSQVLSRHRCQVLSHHRNQVLSHHQGHV